METSVQSLEKSRPKEESSDQQPTTSKAAAAAAAVRGLNGSISQTSNLNFIAGVGCFQPRSTTETNSPMKQQVVSSRQTKHATKFHQQNQRPLHNFHQQPQSSSSKRQQLKFMIKTPNGQIFHKNGKFVKHNSIRDGVDPLSAYLITSSNGGDGVRRLAPQTLTNSKSCSIIISNEDEAAKIQETLSSNEKSNFDSPTKKNQLLAINGDQQSLLQIRTINKRDRSDWDCEFKSNSIGSHVFPNVVQDKNPRHYSPSQLRIEPCLNTVKSMTQIMELNVQKRQFKDQKKANDSSVSKHGSFNQKNDSIAKMAAPNQEQSECQDQQRQPSLKQRPSDRTLINQHVPSQGLDWIKLSNFLETSTNGHKSSEADDLNGNKGMVPAFSMEQLPQSTSNKNLTPIRSKFDHPASPLSKSQLRSTSLIHSSEQRHTGHKFFETLYNDKFKDNFQQNNRITSATIIKEELPETSGQLQRKFQVSIESVIPKNNEISQQQPQNTDDVAAQIMVDSSQVEQKEKFDGEEPNQRINDDHNKKSQKAKGRFTVNQITKSRAKALHQVSSLSKDFPQITTVSSQNNNNNNNSQQLIQTKDAIAKMLHPYNSVNSISSSSQESQHIIMPSKNNNNISIRDNSKVSNTGTQLSEFKPLAPVKSGLSFGNQMFNRMKSMHNKKVKKAEYQHQQKQKLLLSEASQDNEVSSQNNKDVYLFDANSFFSGSGAGQQQIMSSNTVDKVDDNNNIKQSLTSRNDNKYCQETTKAATGAPTLQLSLSQEQLSLHGNHQLHHQQQKWTFDKQKQITRLNNGECLMSRLESGRKKRNLKMTQFKNTTEPTSRAASLQTLKASSSAAIIAAQRQQMTSNAPYIGSFVNNRQQKQHSSILSPKTQKIAHVAALHQQADPQLLLTMSSPIAGSTSLMSPTYKDQPIAGATDGNVTRGVSNSSAEGISVRRVIHIKANDVMAEQDNQKQTKITTMIQQRMKKLYHCTTIPKINIDQTVSNENNKNQQSSTTGLARRPGSGNQKLSINFASKLQASSSTGTLMTGQSASVAPGTAPHNGGRKVIKFIVGSLDNNSIGNKNSNRLRDGQRLQVQIKQPQNNQHCIFQQTMTNEYRNNKNFIDHTSVIKQKEEKQQNQDKNSPKRQENQQLQSQETRSLRSKSPSPTQIKRNLTVNANTRFSLKQKQRAATLSLPLTNDNNSSSQHHHHNALASETGSQVTFNNKKANEFIHANNVTKPLAAADKTRNITQEDIRLITDSSISHEEEKKASATAVVMRLNSCNTSSQSSSCIGNNSNRNVVFRNYKPSQTKVDCRKIDQIHKVSSKMNSGSVTNLSHSMGGLGLISLVQQRRPEPEAEPAYDTITLPQKASLDGSKVEKVNASAAAPYKLQNTVVEVKLDSTAQSQLSAASSSENYNFTKLNKSKQNNNNGDNDNSIEQYQPRQKLIPQQHYKQIREHQIGIENGEFIKDQKRNKNWDTELQKMISAGQTQDELLIIQEHSKNTDNGLEAKAVPFCGDTFYEAPLAQGNDIGSAKNSSNTQHAVTNKYSYSLPQLDSGSGGSSYADNDSSEDSHGKLSERLGGDHRSDSEGGSEDDNNIYGLNSKLIISKEPSSGCSYQNSIFRRAKRPTIKTNIVTGGTQKIFTARASLHNNNNRMPQSPPQAVAAYTIKKGKNQLKSSGLKKAIKNKEQSSKKKRKKTKRSSQQQPLQQIVSSTSKQQLENSNIKGAKSTIQQLEYQPLKESVNQQQQIPPPLISAKKQQAQQHRQQLPLRKQLTAAMMPDLALLRITPSFHQKKLRVDGIVGPDSMTHSKDRK